jgi:hypothetical protein
MKPPLVSLSRDLDSGVQGLKRAYEYWQINHELTPDASTAVREAHLVYFQLVQHVKRQRDDLKRIITLSTTQESAQGQRTSVYPWRL